MQDEIDVRRGKLKVLRDAGMNPYPSRAERTASAAHAHADFDALSASGTPVTVAGRVMITRVHGAMMFADVRDASGQLQIQLTQDRQGEASYALFRDSIDPGDFVQVAGTLFTTKRGEHTLAVTDWKVLAKALLPLPEKWHGLQDVELRFRKRYLDLVMNDDVRRRMIQRSKVVSAIRSFLDAQGFLDVETPTLQPVYGGGFARPFTTHHNALDADFYLRISDEMYLKRLLVGGFEKVYEITKVFRNEGIDHDHNPEFTMFEAQIAYQDYRYGMDLFEELFEHAATNVLGTTDVPHGEVTIHLARPWKRMSLVESVREVGGLDVSSWSDVGQAKTDLTPRLKQSKVAELDRMKTVGEVIAFAFEELVEEKLVQPTIIYDYPVEVSPLAKKCADPRYVERFEAFALGSEIGNNYSELNDPEDLERRFVEEKKKADAGFAEAHQTDTDYLDAIRHGMPPACGLGIGIDRMVMLLTGADNIKEVILFPTLRPEQH
ncbi:lysine--tRNA ligase [Candidatus Uhrbacteria bacterium RIFCSPHIGHO2_12_FULL_60_25]|uniref:Lysine--tRNA ligase n=1 Tax=Candidatus Uhrbacteria bacterium RIFCSPHIGHO2_12_FULL_60_25 TaxID=1802399 RepID=A0A1F7UIR8_9BACT|nr:MAG: lysine--tRNA ligase [Candidatus Uhrbacteria bacterium RIFCSPHIGHO2_02_FULL_60_44]OGL78149.1 MAG: lysine--tRNA ligase [Candidatus Uhrbacteria bacterium RIFCSPHIGHO2_12_FULL_60_25]